MLHVRDFGKKLWRFIASFDVCQRVKHPKMSFTTQEKHDFPKRPGYVPYNFVCYDVFSKFIKLSALKSATTKVCLNKLVNHYFIKVIKSKVILSNNASQFRSPSWR